MILNPLLRISFEGQSNVTGLGPVRWPILINVIGSDKRHRQESFKTFSDVHAHWLDQLLPGQSQILLATVRRIKEQSPDLVSFSGSIVDQSPRERVALVAIPIVHTGSITGDASSVNASLFALNRGFIGNVTLPSLVGSESMEDFLKVLEDIQDLEEGSK